MLSRHNDNPDHFNLTCAHLASFLICYTLIKLGYCIGLSKSIFILSQRVPYLGFECDSHLQTFHLLSNKKLKFITLVETILSSDRVSLINLQKLAGKCMSMAVPGTRLFTNEIKMSQKPPALLGPSFSPSHCARKLLTGFFQNHGLFVFPGAPNDITNSRYTPTPPLLRGVVYYILKRPLLSLPIIGPLTSYRPILLSKRL